MGREPPDVSPRPHSPDNRIRTTSNASFNQKLYGLMIFPARGRQLAVSISVVGAGDNVRHPLPPNEWRRDNVMYHRAHLEDPAQRQQFRLALSVRQ